MAIVAAKQSAKKISGKLPKSKRATIVEVKQDTDDPIGSPTWPLACDTSRASPLWASIVEMETELRRVAVARASGIQKLAHAELIVLGFERALKLLRDPEVDDAARAKLMSRLFAARNAFNGLGDFTGPAAFHTLFRVLEDAASYNAWLHRNPPADAVDPLDLALSSAEARIADHTSKPVERALLRKAISLWPNGGPFRNDAVLAIAVSLDIPPGECNAATVGQYISRWRKPKKRARSAGD